MHTKGPWETNGTAIETVATPSYVIGSAYEGDLVAIDESTAEANARLMAAAPDLLDTLIGLSNEVFGSLPLISEAVRREIGNTNYNCLMRRAEEARAIIVKATGA